MPLGSAKRVSTCAPRKVGSDDVRVAPKASPSGPGAPRGTTLGSVKPFCQTWGQRTAANGVTATGPNRYFAPASRRPLSRLLPKLPVAASVGPTPTIVREVVLRNVLKLSAPAR